MALRLCLWILYNFCSRFAEAQFACSDRTPKMQNPAVKERGLQIPRSRKRGFLMSFPMLLLLLLSLRKRRTKFNFQIHLDL
jgi:hypothetical protein